MPPIPPPMLPHIACFGSSVTIALVVVIKEDTLHIETKNKNNREISIKCLQIYNNKNKPTSVASTNLVASTKVVLITFNGSMILFFTMST